jgi:ActR/RegA family two-component response regulator
MAVVLVLIDDLMLGSKVKSALERAGHEVRLAAGRSEAERRLSGAELLLVDLSGEPSEGLQLVEDVREGRLEAEGLRTLAFYPHVDGALRRRAEAAGFDLVVPRSRVAREGATLVSTLAARS